MADDGKEDMEEVREQDRYLPIANISRIMKKSLPANAKIAKDAKETVQECVSEFISFITSEASDKCQQEKRKTINGDDLLWAMSTLGFDKYVEPLRIYLSKYRDSVKGGDKETGKKGSKSEDTSMIMPPMGPMAGGGGVSPAYGGPSGGSNPTLVPAYGGPSGGSNPTYTPPTMPPLGPHGGSG